VFHGVIQKITLAQFFETRCTVRVYHSLFFFSPEHVT